MRLRLVHSFTIALAFSRRFWSSDFSIHLKRILMKMTKCSRSESIRRRGYDALGLIGRGACMSPPWVRMLWWEERETDWESTGMRWEAEEDVGGNSDVSAGRLLVLAEANCCCCKRAWYNGLFWFKSMFCVIAGLTNSRPSAMRRAWLERCSDWGIAPSFFHHRGTLRTVCCCDWSLHEQQFGFVAGSYYNYFCTQHVTSDTPYHFLTNQSR